MEDYDALYLVKIYLNNELIYIEHYVDRTQAIKSSEFWESKGYTCKIYLYQPTEMIYRGTQHGENDI